MKQTALIIRSLSYFTRRGGVEESTSIFIHHNAFETLTAARVGRIGLKTELQKQFYVQRTQIHPDAFTLWWIVNLSCWKFHRSCLHFIQELKRIFFFFWLMIQHRLLLLSITLGTAAVEDLRLNHGVSNLGS